MPTKPQPRTKADVVRVDLSFRGRKASVVRQLADDVRGEGYSEAVSWIVDRWLDSPEGQGYIEDKGIDPKEFRRLKNVVQMPGSS